jgi:flagellar assembly protein FliH
MPSWDAFGSDAMTDCSPGGADKAAIGMPNELETPTRTAAQETKAEELKQSFESGRLRGFEDGRAAEREAAAALAKTLETRWIEQSARLVAGFDAQRTQYFETVEPEVVKLSLAVAARILRRESQMDPLLLSGAVRVALGQLSSATQVRLRVPAADVDLWRETIAHLPNLCVKPAIVADDEMSLGECALESEFGSADLGIASHLAEIERGFFDRTGADRAGAGAIAVTKDMLR